VCKTGRRWGHPRSRIAGRSGRRTATMIGADGRTRSDDDWDRSPGPLATFAREETPAKLLGRRPILRRGGLGGARLALQTGGTAPARTRVTAIGLHRARRHGVAKRKASSARPRRARDRRAGRAAGSRRCPSLPTTARKAAASSFDHHLEVVVGRWSAMSRRSPEIVQRGARTRRARERSVARARAGDPPGSLHTRRAARGCRGARVQAPVPVRASVRRGDSPPRSRRPRISSSPSP